MDLVRVFCCCMHKEVKVGKIKDHLLDGNSLVSCASSYMPASLEVEGVEVLFAENTEAF
jgi:hypothetical protein